MGERAREGHFYRASPAPTTGAVQRPEPGYLIPMNEYPYPQCARSLLRPSSHKKSPARSVLPRGEPTPFPWLRDTFNGRAVAYARASRSMQRVVGSDASATRETEPRIEWPRRRQGERERRLQLANLSSRNDNWYNRCSN